MATPPTIKIIGLNYITDEELGAILKKTNKTREAFEATKLSTTDLFQIRAHHRDRSASLSRMMSVLQKELESIPKAHSVHGRVKDADHLIEKIIRKAIEDGKKFDLSNYANQIQDLIGLRVLHLLKEEWTTIHHEIIARWEIVEDTKINIREGDKQEEKEDLKKIGVDLSYEINKRGYRSVHYVISAFPTKQAVIAEIQTRTLFEESWSEIDHMIRYPNKGDEKLLASYLETFNRIAGTADEMGSFVVRLADFVEQTKKAQSDAADGKKVAPPPMSALLEALLGASVESAARSRAAAKVLEEMTKSTPPPKK